MLDAIVVGAGPAGSRVAYKLAEMGHEVAVLEQNEIPGEHVCCTGIIGQECVSALEIESRVIFRQAKGASIYSPSGKLLRLWRPEFQASIVDRVAFDMAMIERARARGARYVHGCTVRKITVVPKKVSVDFVDRESRSSLEARAAVIATGFGSRLTEELGLGKCADFVIGAQIEVPSSLDEIEVHFGRDIAPGFFAWLVPTSPNRALVGLLSRHNPGFYLNRFMSSSGVREKIDPYAAEIRYGGIPLKPLPRTYADRILVVGDAAGQVKPITGGGIYYGILCADIAAETLHRGLTENHLMARSLAAYERTWKTKLGRELKIGYMVRKFCERLSDGQIDRIFDIINAQGISEAYLSFDWHAATLLHLMEGGLMPEIARIFKLPLRKGRKPKISEVSSYERKQSKPNS